MSITLETCEAQIDVHYEEQISCFAGGGSGRSAQSLLEKHTSIGISGRSKFLSLLNIVKIKYFPED